MKPIIKSAAGSYEQAYFTLEAALMLPMVLLFTVLMIFLAFYSYDRCVLEHSAYEAALRGTGSHFETAEESRSAAYAAAGRLVEGKLFAMHDFRYQASADGGQVTVSYHCVVNMPMLSWLSEYIPDINLALDISRSASRIRQARTIRECRAVNKLFGVGQIRQE